MPVSRQTYAGIAADLEERIRLGEYPPGARLPTYRQLAGMYSVSISTAQRAVMVLRAREVVRGEQGRAVFVVEAPRPTA